MTPVLLVILQNGYGTDEGYVPTYRHEGFRSSHTGKRLREALPDNADIVIINASPKIGDSVDSCFPPDIEYVKESIDYYSPAVILACGVIAKRAIENVDVNAPVFKMPHPAYRGLSKDITQKIKLRIERFLENEYLR